jgi:hypothetical protein
VATRGGTCGAAIKMKKKCVDKVKGDIFGLFSVVIFEPLANSMLFAPKSLFLG